MPPAPLNPTKRYLAVGIRKVYWVPAIANYLSPTRAELDAGTDLTAEVETLTGWSLQGSVLDTPDMGTTFTSQVVGRRTSPQNDITAYLDQNGNDIRSLLPQNTTGYMVICWAGDVGGNNMDVFPSRVVTQANDSNPEDPGKVTISFAITKIPAIMATIPTP
jgi:hypothetical protein